MSKNKKNLKFLSQSVLLEEGELPRVNTLIIFLVFAMVVSFIAWSMMMKVDEIITVKGIVEEQQNQESKYAFKAYIPSKHIGVVTEGISAIMTIPGITDNSPIIGMIGNVERNPKVKGDGGTYYEVGFKSEEIEKKLKINLMPGMETQMKIIVGSKTLFQSFLGPIIS